MNLDLNPVERLARRLCKALPSEGSMTLAEVQDRLEVESQQARRCTTTGKVRRNLRRQEGQFAKALDLAVAMGWVQTTADACMLTAAGVAFARRSRAGTPRRRSFF
jgi:hypothetical protein